MNNILEQIQTSLNHLRQTKPLVLCLTNHVTMDFMANSLLSLGASPLMSESIDELEELISISQALYINIGTLNKAFIKRALFAADRARSLKKPVILDPVGSGASTLRTTAALELLPLANIIRGNASEILSLSGALGSSKGVDSIHSVEEAMEVGSNLAKKLNTVVVISGAEDFVTEGRLNLKLPFGSNLMPLVTGMGCTMTAVLSAFTCVPGSHYDSAIHATAYFGLCGQLAQQKAKAPGSFKQAFIDALYNPNWEYLKGEVLSHAI